MYFRLSILLVAVCLPILLVAVCLPTYVQADCVGEPWNISWIVEPRTDLRCKLDRNCRKEPSTTKSEEYDKCCTCRSCAIWEGKETELFIEYVSVLGRSLVLSDQAPKETEVFKIVHMNSEMTEIPSNLCPGDKDKGLKERYSDEFKNIEQFFGNIVILNFENNLIREISDLNCLKRLDELNLRNNQLRHISNTSFTSLKHLRYIYLSGNLIKDMDPDTLTSKYLTNLFYADFSHNEMTKLDVSNMLSLYPFCNIDFSSNEINELVNEANFTLNLTITYGPGFVDISDNEMSTWPDFETIFNLEDITQLGHLISFGFDFRYIKLVCDCNIEQFMSRAYDIITVIWRNYMNITCIRPENLAGRVVWEAYEVAPEQFICPVETDCDPRCICSDEPNKNTLFVNCSNSDLKTLPDIPYSRYSHFVSLNVSNNQITTTGNKSYLSRISMLDISGNNLLDINNIVGQLLENATYIDISNNPKLRQLPQTFQYHNICSRNMRSLLINCDCESVWIAKWVRSKPCETADNLFQCEIPEVGTKTALEFHPDELDCSSNGFPFLLETLIATVILILILLGTVLFSYRYELLIICLRLSRVSRNDVLPLSKYDVFLSFNDNDDDVTQWVMCTLDRQLAEAKYRVFLPNRDVAFGTERDSEIIKVLSMVCNFLVVMSESYLQEAEEGMRSRTENEWKYGWNNFTSDRSKNIVLINFDHMSSFEVVHPQIKAFLRVGCTVNFKNLDRNIMQEIFEKLGKPLQVPLQKGKDFENKKQKFTQFELFTVAGKKEELHQIKAIPEKIQKDNEQQEDSYLVSFYIKQIQHNKIVKPNPQCVTVMSKGKGKNSLKDNRQQRQYQYRKCYACHHGNNDNQQEILSVNVHHIKNKNVPSIQKEHLTTTPLLHMT